MYQLRESMKNDNMHPIEGKINPTRIHIQHQATEALRSVHVNVGRLIVSTPPAARTVSRPPVVSLYVSGDISHVPSSSSTAAVVLAAVSAASVLETEQVTLPALGRARSLTKGSLSTTMAENISSWPANERIHNAKGTVSTPTLPLTFVAQCIPVRSNPTFGVGGPGVWAEHQTSSITSSESCCSQLESLPTAIDQQHTATATKHTSIGRTPLKVTRPPWRMAASPSTCRVRHRLWTTPFLVPGSV